MAKKPTTISRAEPAAPKGQTAPAGTPTAASAQEAPSPRAPEGATTETKPAVGEPLKTGTADALRLMEVVRGTEPGRARSANFDFFNQKKHVHAWDKEAK